MREIWEEIQLKSKQLDQAVKSLRINGTAYAEAEKDYKICLREEALKLKSAGNAITFITLIIYGVYEVAIKRLERDIAKVTYEANQEAINSIKLQIRLLDNQISREWSNTHD